MRTPLVDRLWNKHEHYDSEAATLEVEVDGEPVQVLVPASLPTIEPRLVTRDGDFLFVLGAICSPAEWGAADGAGAILVARKDKDGVWGAHVWHELYEWTLGHLGLGEPGR